MNNYESISRQLCEFISSSPSCFHVIKNIGSLLEGSGFTKLRENCPWQLKAGASYYVSRSDSSVIAFTLPADKAENFQIIASHSDSPAFKIKESPELISAGKYVRLNVEKYGGMLMSPWFDRPLSIAGRIVADSKGKLISIPVDAARDLAMIPSLAIHMDRKTNEKGVDSIQSEMLPLFSEEPSGISLLQMIAAQAGIDPANIKGYDLFLYDRSPFSIWGADNEFFSSPRLDDLQCAYSSVRAISDKKPVSGSISLCCIFDNEEVGSLTKQGADSSFLQDVLERICLSLNISREQYLMMLSCSFMLSADNAHALHPNHPEKADPVNQPLMNKGIVIKHSANQKYTTDALSASVFRKICENASVPVQDYVNHSDIPGGSTLGNISAAHVSINTVDIGCAQLAMHSPYETAGIKDTSYMIDAMTAFYQTRIFKDRDGNIVLR